MSRPFPSRFARLLAFALITASLLVNSLAVAHTLEMPAKQDGCAEMMGHKAHSGACDETGKPCPDSGTTCDDQCLMRCQASNALPSFALLLPAIALARLVFPVPASGAVPSADSGPGLRPPISV
jgi:hypothetical protein